jgi:undecaprenyl-diphosphatase
MGDALALGLAQAAALVPGISRSGATRSMARGRGFSRPAAISLSEDAALPVLVGATVLKGARLAGRRPPRRALAALAGGAAAAGSSALALRSRRAAAVPPSAWAAYRTGLAIGALWAARSDRGLRETDGR